ncbi:MAG: class I SAM-dependent methyltransferase, partial [Acidimicrobiales bacterium]
MPPDGAGPTDGYAFDEGHRLYPAVRSALSGPGMEGLPAASLRVHARDDMYRFCQVTRPSEELGTMAYFQRGIQIHRTLVDCARAHFGRTAGPGSICDFAAGYGRSTRFLPAAFPGRDLHAVEIQPEAVEFLEDEIGVRAHLSCTAPEDFGCEAGFDYVFVCSLFSHLPERTFGPWLARLFDLLTPDGLLAFSVHGETVMQPGWTMPAEGILYMRTTEVPSLDLEDYGATVVTEEFVARALREHLGVSAYRRFARGLC